MNIFKRSKSALAKSSQRQPDLPAESPRPPLVAQTNMIDFQLPSTLDLSPLPGPSPSRRFAARQRDSLEIRSVQPPALLPSPRSPSRIDDSSSNSYMYSQNHLQSYSFGQPASSSSMLSPPLDPLSRPREDSDSDDLFASNDVTPRPSVFVGTRSQLSQANRKDSSQTFFAPTPVNSRIQNKVEPDSDATSSVSSLSKLGDGHETNTPQTSSNDLSSDEDNEIFGRHPLPPEPRDSSLPRPFVSADRDSLLYLSEEDFDGFPDEYDHDGFDPEIGTGSDRGTILTARRNSDPKSYSGERRGSIPMAIPNAAPDRSYLDPRGKDQFFINKRRPSKSLEDISTFAFAQVCPSTNSRRLDERPLPPAPTSVPESEGDWRDLRKRSVPVQREKELPPLSISPPALPSTFSLQNSANDNCSATTVNSAMDGFDASWMQEYQLNGVVGFDLSEMTDIVGDNNLSGYRASLYPFRKGSASSAIRRQSTVSSTNIDIIHKFIVGDWANEKFQTQRRKWMFTKTTEGDAKHRQNTGQEKERPGLSNIFSASSSRPSTVAEPSNIITAGLPFFDKPEPKEKEKEKSKEKPHKEPWRGMALDSEEVWQNTMTGKYRVVRKNTTSVEKGKPNQQRINVSCIRTSFFTEGPYVTIHKHSKAGAFSLSRSHRAKHIGPTHGHDGPLTIRHATSMGHISVKESPEEKKKKQNMILLATHRVQRAYTSTSTTRMLEAYGFLDDKSPRDLGRLKREHDLEKRARVDKSKDKEKREQAEKKRSDPSSSSKQPSFVENDFFNSKDVSVPKKFVADSPEGSSVGSVSNAMSGSEFNRHANISTATTPDNTEGTSSNRTVVSVDSFSKFIFSESTNSSDRTILHDYAHIRRHLNYESAEGDDSGDERPRYHTRTPHSETYAALPPEVFETAHHDHPSHGLFGGLIRSKGGDRQRANPYLEKSYLPPWPVTQPRSNPETRRGIVDDLNTSFQDVGLLPAYGEIHRGPNTQNKHKRDQHKPKRVERTKEINQVADVFAEIPDEALYMILPLWPGDTDGESSKKYPFTAPEVALNKRQYLLIYYKTQPSAPAPSPKSTDKKRTHESPSTPSETVNDRVVLLSTFHISARVYSHCDLQGSSVRIPSNGLAVSGPLKEAYDSMPPLGMAGGDYVVGFCHSREKGFEFVSEGFDRLGLCVPVKSAEDDDRQSLDSSPDVMLTPIGRAVMEMAWLGGMAVTSFNPNLN